MIRRRELILTEGPLSRSAPFLLSPVASCSSGAFGSALSHMLPTWERALYPYAISVLCWFFRMNEKQASMLPDRWDVWVLLAVEAMAMPCQSFPI